MKHTKALFIAQSAIIAALYVVLTYLTNLIPGLASGPVQIRFSEALTVLPCFIPAAVPGLFIGCILANALTGCLLWDIVFGSIATLIGAVFTYILRKYKWTAPIPPIIANTLIVPFILVYIYQLERTIPYYMLTVGIGEIISCGILGTLLIRLIKRYGKHMNLI